MNEIGYTMQKVTQLIEPSVLKIVIASILSLGFFLFGHLYTDALIAICMLMIFDALTAICATVYEGNAITSRRFSRTLLKGIVYFMAISAGYFADLTVPFDIIQGTMVAFVGVTEFISIIENIGRMGYETPKKLLNQLKDFRSSK